MSLPTFDLNRDTKSLKKNALNPKENHNCNNIKNTLNPTYLYFLKVQSVKKYSRTTNKTFTIWKAETSNPASPWINVVKAGIEKQIKKCISSFSQHHWLSLEGNYHNIFLTDCLKTKSNYKMEGVNSGQLKILWSIFLCKFFIFRSKTDKINFPETRKRMWINVTFSASK